MRVYSSSFWLMLCSLGWLNTGLPCLGDDGWEGQILSFTWENDAVAQTDRHYTQGARVAWLSRDEHLPGFLKSISRVIPALGMEVEVQKWGLALSQEIYTPENLMTDQLIAEDRPYGGWLYGSVSLQRRGKASFGWLAMETFRLDLGVVGPESMADDTQKTWHGVAPEGWHHQLRTEIGAVLNYNRKYLLALRSPDNFWGCDFIPHLGVSAGNVASYLALGSTLRFGVNLPNEFAAGTGEPVRFGAYLFTGVEGRLVARNIFLDGNTFVRSHHVEKEFAVADWKVGLTVVLKNIELTAAQTFRSWEFETQESLDSFGTATVTIKF